MVKVDLIYLLFAAAVGLVAYEWQKKITEEKKTRRLKKIIAALNGKIAEQEQAITKLSKINSTLIEEKIGEDVKTPTLILSGGHGYVKRL